MGIGFIALLAIASIAVDMGRIAFTATEVQTAAEIAATAGATKLFQEGDERYVRKDARDVLQTGNRIDQQPASERTLAIQVGSFDPEFGFTPNNTRAGGTGSPNSVKATVTVEVANLMRGMFGSPTSRVRKSAVAQFVPSCEERPEIPFAIGDGPGFSDDCYTDSCLPRAIQIPSPSTGWTAFDRPANREQIERFLPTECGGRGETLERPLRVGDRITTNNRLNDPQQQELLEIVRCMHDRGQNEFLAPVVSYKGGHLDGEILGFVTIIIDEVTAADIVVHPIFVADRPSCPSDRNFGTGSVKIVE
jgi:hypothetical protein